MGLLGGVTSIHVHGSSAVRLQNALEGIVGWTIDVMYAT